MHIVFNLYYGYLNNSFTALSFILYNRVLSGIRIIIMAIPVPGVSPPSPSLSSPQ